MPAAKCSMTSQAENLPPWLVSASCDPASYTKIYGQWQEVKVTHTQSLVYTIPSKSCSLYVN